MKITPRQWFEVLRAFVVLMMAVTAAFMALGFFMVQCGGPR